MNNLQHEQTQSSTYQEAAPYQGPEPLFVTVFESQFPNAAALNEKFRNVFNHRADSIIALAHPYEVEYLRLLNSAAEAKRAQGVMELVDAFPYSSRENVTPIHHRIAERQIYNFLVKHYARLGLPKDNLVRLHAKTEKELLLEELAYVREHGGSIMLGTTEFHYDVAGKLVPVEETGARPARTSRRSIADRVRALLTRRR